MDEKEYITNSLNEMLDSKDIQNMQLASNIIKNQPDMIEKSNIHWYKIDEIINPKNVVKLKELYMSSDKSDKVYIASIRIQGKDYITEGHYGRRGKSIKTDLKYKGLFISSAEDEFDSIVRQKLKKGYIQISES